MTVLERVRDHWLTAANLVVAVFVGLPFLAPVLMAVGFVGAANAIYAAYQVVCHQWAFRSFFLFGPKLAYGPEELGPLVGQHVMYGFIGSPDLGYKVAFCERDVAIYLAVLFAGLLYARYRDALPPLGVTGYAVLIAPMALDGFTQLFGWRESSVVLRTLTGALFGVASVWLIYPRLDALFERDPEPVSSSVSSRASQTAGTASARPA
ncbi:MAG: DUF2085 domain-containing protein [Chloroflexota bacterium]